MDIIKQIIDQRVNKIADDDLFGIAERDPERNRSKAFLLLGVAAYLDIDLEEAVQYLTDGGNTWITGRKKPKFFGWIVRCSFRETLA